MISKTNLVLNHLKLPVKLNNRSSALLVYEKDTKYVKCIRFPLEETVKEKLKNTEVNRNIDYLIMNVKPNGHQHSEN